tara:strand:+ start:335 stop:892 length:558 start_codon:yes stop_codon:yes gene_type:complete
MAIKTMSASTGGSKFEEGWHEVVISKAEYGNYESDVPGNDKRYLDIWFEDYPDNMNLRAYEVFNKTTKEEFKVANIFKYANAGIVGVLKDPNGKHPLIQFDDDPKGLIGKNINIYIYKENKSGNNYSRVFDSIAPIVQEGEHLSFKTTDVDSIKSGAENRVKKMLEATAKVTPNGINNEPFANQF